MQVAGGGWRAWISVTMLPSFCVFFLVCLHPPMPLLRENASSRCPLVDSLWNRQAGSKLVTMDQGTPGFFSTAAAAAKSLQSCPTLCDPTDGSPPGSPVPGILQARTLEWGAISFSLALVHMFTCLGLCLSIPAQFICVCKLTDWLVTRAWFWP